MWVAGCRGQCAAPRASVGVELGVPVKVVAPALMQVVWREGAPILLKHVGRRLNRAVARVHPALPGQPVSLPQIASGARGHDVGPDRTPAAGPRHQMVKGQLVRRIRLATILAGKTVAEKDVEACKRRMPRRGNVFLQ